MNKSKQLGEEKISKLLLRFSIPAIIGMLVNALYNVVDRIFIGRGVGSLAIAGITIAFPAMLIIMACGMLVGIGANSLVSIRLGQDKKDEAEVILGNSMVLLIALSASISILGLAFLDPILKALGASEAVLPYAKDYLRIILFGTVFQSIGFGMNNFIRGEGNPKIAMGTMLIGAFLNTVLDPIFIFGFGWGIKGAALATIISQFVSALWVLYYFLGGRSTLKIHPRNLKLRLPIILSIFSLGIAPFSMQFAASILNVVLNKSLKLYGGDLAISAMGIVSSIMTLMLMPIFGINQGMQPIIGFNYGAKKYDRVKTALKLGIGAATLIVTLGYIAIRLFPEQFVSLFNKGDESLIYLGTKALKTYLFFLPIIGFQIVGANYFQAVGKPKHSMILSLSRQVLILIPAIIILPRFIGLDGILIAGPIADLLSSILTGTWLMIELKSLDRQYREGYLT